jgi:hypothetical protein
MGGSALETAGVVGSIFEAVAKEASSSMVGGVLCRMCWLVAPKTLEKDLCL